MVRLSDFPVAPWLRLPAFLALLIILPISTTPQTIAAAPAPCSMTDSQMKAMSDAWFATHPRTGVASLAPASGTVNVGNFYFNADNNLSTQIDTVKISAGESVTWNWVAGSHTLTSGTGSGDPNAGSLFDQPINSASTSFTFAFPDPGIYPYFCRFHELSMHGYVKVQSVAGVTPIAGGGETPGFVTSPSPNPTSSGASFRFALAAPGRTRIEVFDVAGRRIAVVLDSPLEKGAFQMMWDGRAADGSPVRSGVYFVKLAGPGVSQARRLIVKR